MWHFWVDDMTVGETTINGKTCTPYIKKDFYLYAKFDEMGKQTPLYTNGIDYFDSSNSLYFTRLDAIYYVID